MRGVDRSPLRSPFEQTPLAAAETDKTSSLERGRAPRPAGATQFGPSTVVEYESLRRDDDPNAPCIGSAQIIAADAECRGYKELGDSAFTQKGIVAPDRNAADPLSQFVFAVAAAASSCHVVRRNQSG